MERLATRLDEFGARHPFLTLATTFVLAVVVTIVLLYQFNAPAVVYEFF